MPGPVMAGPDTAGPWPAQQSPAGGGGLSRLLPPAGQPGGDLAAHLGRHGPVRYRGGTARLIPEVRAAGLTGRGGAAFPVHRKLEAVAAAGPGRAIVVGNAAEGEPASHKDEALLRLAPHLVLDGLQLAAEAVGSAHAVLYVRRDLHASTRLDLRMTERAPRGLDRAAVEIVPAPTRFLAGEESALASLVSGGEAVPRFTPPRVFERGVDGRPTLVQNVETLAHLALIARYGPGWFRAAGTREEPGTMLCTLRQAERRGQRGRGRDRHAAGRPAPSGSCLGRTGRRVPRGLDPGCPGVRAAAEQRHAAAAGRVHRRRGAGRAARGPLRPWSRTARVAR